MEKKFDVFLSHNNKDKAAVEHIARRLEAVGLKPFLDKWHLIPGEPWQEVLEEALTLSATVAVFIGPTGISPWHNEEMRDVLNTRAMDKSYRVIPVLLPGAALPDRGELPRFLSRLTWVDFRDGLDDDTAFHFLLSGIRGKPPGMGQVVIIPSDEAPYRGLQKFRPRDAPWFFGRQSEIQQMFEKIKNENFLSVLGASGSGKSSVVLAGLVPEIQRGKIQGSQRWPIIIFTPTEHPVEELALHLAPHIPEIGPTALINEFEIGPRGLCLNVREMLMGSLDEKKCILVVDQFEEVFTLCNDEQERQTFLDQLLYAAGTDTCPVKIIITMRADFMGKCALYPQLADRMAKSQLIITPMEENQLREAIIRPAERSGILLEPGLVDHIIRDVADEPGGLPLLEHALLELWNRRQGNVLTHAAYGEIGGVSGAVSRTANRVYNKFSPAEKEITKRIFLSLIQLGEGTIETRRRAKLSNLIANQNEITTVENLVGALADRRLVTTDLVGGESIINISHEALIQNWPQLRLWIDENREGLRIHHHLSETADGWESRGRDPGELYRGTRLAQTVEWANTYGTELSSMEKVFLDASQEALVQEQRIVRRRWFVIVGVLMIAFVIATLGITGQLNRLIFRPLPVDWVEILAGDFSMGSVSTDPQASLNEHPQHTVYLDSYQIGRFEITNRQFNRCVFSGVCPNPSSLMGDQNLLDHPVVYVTWYDAQTFCEWIGGRLPTEAEWEKAARGGLESKIYPWGNEKPDCSRANFYEDDFCVGDTTAVGSYDPNAYGLYDMAGNVWEWTADWYYFEYYTYSPKNNPLGPEGGSARIIRGGSWGNFSDVLRVANRPYMNPDSNNALIGFRCVHAP